MTTSNSSSSKFQQELETKKIIPALKEYFTSISINLDLDANHYFNLDANTKVQVDLCDTKNNIFGEIYTCGDKLLSGQQRKISSDILKLLTVDKNSEKEINKYLIFTSNLEGEKNKIVEDADFKITKKLLGEKSWKIKTISLFKIRVLVYNLSETEKIELDKIKEIQGAKFRIK